MSFLKFSFAQKISTSNGDQLLGWQSPWHVGEHYAAAFLYDKSSKSLFITGTESVNDSLSNCFSSKVSREDGEIKFMKKFASTGLTSCSSITKGWDNKENFLAGFTKDDIFQLDGTFSLENKVTKAQYISGFFLTGLKETGLGGEGGFLNKKRVQYPLVTEYDDRNRAIVIASLVSEDSSMSKDYLAYDDVLPPILHPNPMSGTFKYGSSFHIELQQFTVDDGGIEVGWSHTYEFQNGNDVRVSDLIVYKDRIIYVGATYGLDTDHTNVDASQSLDGYVIQIDAKNGQLYVDENVRASKRIQSQIGEEDIVNAICASEATGSIYLAGTSTGYLGGGTLNSEHANEQMKYNRFSAFIVKLDADTLDVDWSRMIHTYASDTISPQHVIGMSCAVSSDGDIVYLGGVVKNNGNVNVDKSNGKDDVFLASWNTKDGKRRWRKQIGTDENDVMNIGHQSMTMDENDNVLLVGSTQGIMYNDKNTGKSDVFVINLSKLGYIVPFISQEKSITETAIGYTASHSSQTTEVALSKESSSTASGWSTLLIAVISLATCLFVILSAVLALKHNKKAREITDASINGTNGVHEEVHKSSEPSDKEVSEAPASKFNTSFYIEDYDYDETKLKEIV